MGIESCSTWPPLSIHSQRDLTCPLLPLNHSHVHNRHHYPSPWGLWLWLTCICHDLSMFTLIYYRLYIFNYKYLAVAVVSPQPCLHLTLASIQQAPHCFLSFSVSVGLLCPHQISSDHHWPSSSTEYCLTQVEHQGSARPWHDGCMIIMNPSCAHTIVLSCSLKLCHDSFLGSLY